MKRQLAAKLVLLGIGGFLAGCGSGNNLNNKAGGGPLSVLIPWPKADHSYELSVVNLETITDIYHLQGRIASVHAEASLDERGFRGPLINAQFMQNANGVFVPKDPITLQATTIYAHLEKLYFLDQKLGVHDWGQWPIDVGVKIQLLDKDRTSTFNNAAYAGASNSMIFVPTTTNDLNVDFNAGFIAHEHFHSLFYNQVFRFLPASSGSIVNSEALGADRAKTCLDNQLALARYQHEAHPQKLDSADYNATLLRTFDEGLADYWGWIYTGDTNYFAPSFTGGGLQYRALVAKSKPMMKAEKLLRLTEALARYRDLDPLCLRYEVGSTISNLLYQLALAQLDDRDPAKGLSQDERMQMAQQLADALPKLATAVKSRYQYEPLTIEQLTSILVQSVPKTKKVCDLLRQAYSNPSELPEPCSKRGL